MDNLQYIECHQRICHLFFIFSLTCCKFVALKKNALTHSFQNHYSRQTKHPPQGFPFGEIRMSHQGRKMGAGWGVSLQTQKFDISPPVGYHPTRKLSLPVPPLITDHRLEKRIFTKHFACGMHFPLQNHDLFEKAHWN